MKTRALGSSGFIVSSIGVGCMGMSQGYGAIDDPQSLAALDAALENGLTFWDTAQSYGAGHNERLLAQAIAGRRRAVQIATKVGIVRTPEGVRLDARPATIRESCEASLARLGVEAIDLYYLHRVDPSTPIEESIGAMADLVAAGKVRRVGICECGVEALERAAAVHPIAALQCEWSLWWREAEDAVIPAARRLGIGIVPYSPLGRGFLAGSDLPASFAPGDFRYGDFRFEGEERRRNEETLAAMRPLAASLDLSLGQLSLAWLLAQGADVVPIPGMRKAARMAENAAAADVALSTATLARLDAVAGRSAWAGDRRSFAAYGVKRSLA